eukprot:TRINITY_DN2326_c0_g1_i1.p2 TRINITY_DN2326_c0_g1~~TRINITY_DN2326_c0_g1_i1.p2  ORF type:complete len:127 (+),score=0.47 TRINITY_DN2326_c0_g1_i1:893-1273(+)
MGPTHFSNATSRAYRFITRIDTSSYLSKFLTYPVNNQNLREWEIQNKEPQYETVETFQPRKVRVTKAKPWKILQPELSIAELESDPDEWIWRQGKSGRTRTIFEYDVKFGYNIIGDYRPQTRILDL